MTQARGQKYGLRVDAADPELADLDELSAGRRVAEMWAEAVRGEGYEPREFLGIRVCREGVPWLEELSPHDVSRRPVEVYMAHGHTSKETP